MAAASKDVVCVYVDLEWGRRHADLAQRYGVRVMPTVIYVDSEGEEVGRMRSPDPESMTADLDRLAREHTRKLN